MKNLLVFIVTLLLALSVYADDFPAMDIVTIYGETFKNAQIVNINPTTVDISYIDNYNMPAMRGVKLKDLTPELQAKLGYDPVAAAENEKKQAELRQNQFIQLRLQENQLQKKVSLQVQQRQSGQNIPIDLDELYTVIYQGRIAVSAVILSYGKEGALANVTGKDGDDINIPDNIIILDLDVPAGSSWAGYIYPTMMMSSQRLPVYCANAENAINSVNTTLKLTTESDAQQNNDNINTAPAASNQSQPQVIIVQQPVDNGVVVTSQSGNYYPYVYPRVIQPAYIRPCPRPPWPPGPPHPPGPFVPQPGPFVPQPGPIILPPKSPYPPSDPDHNRGNDRGNNSGLNTPGVNTPSWSKPNGNTSGGNTPGATPGNGWSGIGGFLRPNR